MFGALLGSLVRGVGTAYTREVHPHASKAFDERNKRILDEENAKEAQEAHARAVAHKQRQKELDRARFSSWPGEDSE